MDITRDQRFAWSKRPENHEWENLIAPYYKQTDGTVNVDVLHKIADLNGLFDPRKKYAHLNPGQIAMNIRNRLRVLWKNGSLNLPA
ncbi:hypothetical protein [Mesorhizobium sp. WSM3860]|uniref:hypothetical protein n=1 Tax=Mesorhizobium sp. WSM3860 TaxID=2029403 RepID=UPI001140D8E0|nr:hypothetical protein [Mesorhizobium sp. WSM3860]